MRNPSLKEMIVNGVVGLTAVFAIFGGLMVVCVPIALSIAGKIYGVEVALF